VEVWAASKFWRQFGRRRRARSHQFRFFLIPGSPGTRTVRFVLFDSIVMAGKKKKGGGGGGGKKKKGGGAAKPAPGLSPTDLLLPLLPSPQASAVQSAVVSSDVRTLTRLAAHYNYLDHLADCDANGSTPVHIACRRNDLDMLRKLLAYQVRVCVVRARITAVRSSRVLPLASDHRREPAGAAGHGRIRRAPRRVRGRVCRGRAHLGAARRRRASAGRQRGR
jgi:hypothetical protein